MRFHALIMTSLTLRQLDRTRQPGFAQRGASWSAPVQTARDESSSIGGIDVAFGEYKSIDGRDSRPSSKSGAGAVSGAFTP
jgi:hypothetical protein